MKFANIIVDGAPRAAVFDGDWKLLKDGLVTDDIIAGAAFDPAEAEAIDGAPVFGNVVTRPGKLLCVGLNYRSHADKVGLKRADCPILFSKFSDSLVPTGSEVYLPPWEDSYDYEAELVIVIGKTAVNVSVEEAGEYIFGYTAGNDLSVRDPQMRTSQWLIGKAMPGFGPCGPCITQRGDVDVEAGISIKSYVNGELRQDGSTDQMIFSCSEIVSFASKYIRLNPGDLIYTGTPAGVNLEKKEKNYLRPGDVVSVTIGGIGTLENRFI